MPTPPSKKCFTPLRTRLKHLRKHQRWRSEPVTCSVCNCFVTFSRHCSKKKMVKPSCEQQMIFLNTRRSFRSGWTGSGGLHLRNSQGVKHTDNVLQQELENYILLLSSCYSCFRATIASSLHKMFRIKPKQIKSNCV